MERSPSHRTTNHERFVAVFKRRIGRTFTSKEIFAIMSAESDIEPGSIQPSFHSAPEKAPRCPCSGTPQQLFTRVKEATYRVRNFRK